MKGIRTRAPWTAGHKNSPKCASARDLAPQHIYLIYDRRGENKPMSTSWNWLLLAAVMLFGMTSAPADHSSSRDEDTIRQMVADAIRQLNQGDLSAISAFWDEDADYVGIDGQFIRNRQGMEVFFAQLLKAGAGTETATIERVRFLNSDIAVVDGSWTLTGAKGQDGRALPVIRGRGCEMVQKKKGHWRFIATREMAVWTPGESLDKRSQ
jgi:uncharacterized protein (TIGR02246 family)